MSEFAELEAALGHRFTDPVLLDRALSHRSLRPDASNERLEFLGDRVLGLAVADMAFRRSDADEGELALWYNGLVQRETLALVARTLGLGPLLRLAKGEDQSGGRERDATLADACEAVLGAVYLDAGFDIARDVVVRLWAPHAGRGTRGVRDPKTALQEWAVERGWSTPRYAVISREGPDHAPSFVVEVTLDDGSSARGAGGSKRIAEREAAQRLLTKNGVSA